MTWKKRLALGGLGGLLVYLVNLYHVEYERMILIMPDYDWLPQIAAVVAAVPFMVAGGIWALVHVAETRAFRVFEIGLLVPALFVAYIAGAELGRTRTELYQVSDPRAATTALSSPWERPAWEGSARTFPMPAGEGLEMKFMRAISGVERERSWFVVADSPRTLEAALEQAEAVNRDQRGYKAAVYRPYGENPFFRVVIGADLPFHQAVQLRDKAIEAGIQAEPRLIQHRK
ncbi:MAG: hypothetical protein FJY85_00110 [Deltaproteobacteria bacterium]|nr:hypothetical protein [Deltaproteobacteria bacterium]